MFADHPVNITGADFSHKIAFRVVASGDVDPSRSSLQNKRVTLQLLSADAGGARPDI